MPQESNISQKTRRKWPIALAFATFLVVLAAACTDYAVLQSREKPIIAIATQLGGQPYSIGGWPFGEEHLIMFSRPLTNDELQQLATLSPIHHSGRHSIRVHFKNCNLSEKRMREIRDTLQGIPVIRTIVEVPNQQTPIRRLISGPR